MDAEGDHNWNWNWIEPIPDSTLSQSICGRDTCTPPCINSVGCVSIPDSSFAVNLATPLCEIRMRSKSTGGFPTKRSASCMSSFCAMVHKAPSSHWDADSVRLADKRKRAWRCEEIAVACGRAVDFAKAFDFAPLKGASLPLNHAEGRLNTPCPNPLQFFVCQLSLFLHALQQNPCLRSPSKCLKGQLYRLHDVSCMTGALSRTPMSFTSSPTSIDPRLRVLWSASPSSSLCRSRSSSPHGQVTVEVDADAEAQVNICQVLCMNSTNLLRLPRLSGDGALLRFLLPSSATADALPTLASAWSGLTFISSSTSPPSALAKSDCSDLCKRAE